MPNMELLKEAINKSKMTVTGLCEISGIERATLYNRLNGRGEWTASEIVNVSTALRLTKPERDKIFLQ